MSTRIKGVSGASHAVPKRIRTLNEWKHLEASFAPGCCLSLVFVIILVSLWCYKYRLGELAMAGQLTFTVNTTQP